jgi:serine/threonine-protein kinase
MEPERWQSIRRIFQEASELGGETRERYLAEACGADEALGDEVRRLLANLDGQDGEQEDELKSIVSGAVASTSDRVPREDERIGSYRIVEIIGEGGMGKVYLAERADAQYRQRVAIKIVGSHAATSQIIERFLAERQILANLDHPYIARLLDGGETDDGLPYLVMEYVEGCSIIDYCRDQDASLEERLDLFVKVCDAVDHAHRNLVIHRDIKPANIWVTEQGIPKLLDFGIAKLLDADAATDGMALTRADVRVLTPEYASPEQVTGAPVTTATDVYGLGLLLYELLTDRFPYGSREDMATDWRKVICETDPLPPSTAIARHESTTDTRAMTARPSPGVRQRQAALRGDLDNVVMTAIRKEPGRRYAGARALADDIRAFLDHRPVAARADTPGYRLAKFVRRHRVGVATTVGVLVFTIGLIAFYTDRLAKERDAARLAAATSAKVVAFMTTLFGEADPKQSLGQPVTARTLLDSGAQRLQRELKDEPEVRATMLGAVGQSYASMGEFQAALAQFEEALADRRGVYPDDHPEVAEALIDVGRMQLELGDFDAAGVSLAEAGRILDANDITATVTRARLRMQVAHLKRQEGDYQESETLFQEAIAILRELDPAAREELTAALTMYGGLLTSLERKEDSLAAMAEALAIRRSLYGEIHPGVAASYNNLGTFYMRQGDQDEAERYLRLSLDLKRQLYGESNIRVGRSLANLAVVQHRRGQYREAEQLNSEALPIFVAALGEDHPHVAFLLENMANDQLELGRHEEAMATYRASLERMETIFGTDNVEYGISLSNVGGALVVMGRYQEASDYLEQADVIYVETLGPEHPQVLANKAKWASAQFGLGNYAVVEAETRRILAETEQLYDVHESIAGPREFLGRAVLARDRPEEAVPILKQSVEDWRAASGDANNNVWRASIYYAEGLIALGRYEEAEALLAESYPALDDFLGAGHPDTRSARDIYRRLYVAWKRPGQAARYEPVRPSGGVSESGAGGQVDAAR